MTVTANTGAQAVVNVDGEPVQQVQLKRVTAEPGLSGIWAVIGYEPR